MNLVNGVIFVVKKEITFTIIEERKAREIVLLSFLCQSQVPLGLNRC
jgi:hypothetical protein